MQIKGEEVFMKKLYSILIAMVALFVFAPLADAKPPFWDDQVNSPGRFKKLSEFSNAAVFDKETGLVWEQSPGTTQANWLLAQSHCNTKTVGNRKGWRLPTIQEVASLVDPTNASPALPDGHPFTLTTAQEDGFFWSATTGADGAGVAWVVRFDSGGVGSGVDKSSGHFVWCVRGGQGVDPQ
ncbi:MAG: DUF1566 domain-containing protein [Deltaproteobacteria bacterium]|nr:DUF1566 domain-containing protein [Deltaproteobacteria bacterium]